MAWNGAPPVVAVFSLAGGVGKTCLVATLGRALAALGEHVLLADTAACGLLPLLFRLARVQARGGSHLFSSRLLERIETTRRCRF